MSATRFFRRPWGIGFVLFAVLPTAPAQVVTEADIERARRETPVVSDADIAAAARRHALPPLPPPPSVPSLDALPRPAEPSSLDLDAVARGYQSDTARGSVPGIGAGPRLLVFVSLAMPRESLKRLLAQAERARASVLLRGLVDQSLPATVARIQALGSGSGVQIDPRAFARFGVSRIPSVVLLPDGAAAAPCAESACPPPADFLKAAGDVSLDYALERLRDAAPRHAPAAAVFLKRLRG